MPTRPTRPARPPPIMAVGMAAPAREAEAVEPEAAVAPEEVAPEAAVPVAEAFTVDTILTVMPAELVLWMVVRTAEPLPGTVPLRPVVEL